ncbi:hypothetical protein L484_008033 [Morus notabilis]|uniref:Myb-like domain-containing protein n=1 Tax=Morus notabilis TaxID=981085 RepID=W9R598_9ROSA|nr:neural Wiskott-Aldrich syndrome protein [Morus notabilis]EXB38375.1 hypothetical protein L484_008033 [Morus notabilis]
MASPAPSPPDSSPPPPGPPQAIPLALPAPPLPSQPQTPPPPPSSSSQPQPQSQSQPPPPSSSSSRRLPPPCWSPDETAALIDSYRDKWYSLRRGNLKATHWQEVAEAVAARCPTASPAKTAVQCRHKMEKLRKRYRTELQRARSMPVSRFNSSWVHFKRMDAMEKGPSSVKPENSDSPVDDDDHDNDNYGDDDEDPDQRLYEELRFGSNSKNMGNLYRNGGGGGFRIRIPTGVSIAQPGTKFIPKFDQKGNSGSNSGVNFGTKVVKECSSGRASGLGKRERERDPVGEMVSAIKALGEGFVRMEQMKMEMAREIETIRMEMEMKRTEMILDSQQRIVEAFAKAMSDKKKKKLNKRMPSPEA